MINAIVFDCFGVLAEDGWTPFKRRYLADPELAQQVAAIGKAVDEGRATYEEMIHKTAHIAGVEEAVVRVAVERKVPNEALLTFIHEQLKPGYKIGILSNASYNVLDRLFTPVQTSMFDATALSYEMGLVKPDTKAYQAIAERLGTVVEQCLLVDDKASHCAGALKAGMQAVQYKSVEQLRQALADLGVTWR